MEELNGHVPTAFGLGHYNSVKTLPQREPFISFVGVAGTNLLQLQTHRITNPYQHLTRSEFRMTT